MSRFFEPKPFDPVRHRNRVRRSAALAQRLRWSDSGREPVTTPCPSCGALEFEQYTRHSFDGGAAVQESRVVCNRCQHDAPRDQWVAGHLCPRCGVEMTKSVKEWREGDEVMAQAVATCPHPLCAHEAPIGIAFMKSKVPRSPGE